MRRNEGKTFVDPSDLTKNCETQKTISRMGAWALAKPLPEFAICTKGSISLAMKESDQKVDSGLHAESEVLDVFTSISSEKKEDEAKAMMIEGDATNTLIFKSAPQTSNILSTCKQASNTPNPEVCKHYKGAATASQSLQTVNYGQTNKILSVILKVEK